MTDFFLLVFVLAGSLLRWADANANIVECEGQCSEDLRISCEDLLNEYDFQGSCCSLETIPAYDGCRVRVGHGNCYWYPKCDECPLRTESRWRDVKCGLEYRGAEGYDCPTSEYPTNWKEPHVEGPWNDYSCSPTASPNPAAVPTAGGDYTTSPSELSIPPGIIAVLTIVALFVFALVVLVCVRWKHIIFSSCCTGPKSEHT